MKMKIAPRKVQKFQGSRSQQANQVGGKFAEMKKEISANEKGKGKKKERLNTTFQGVKTGRS